MEENTEVQNTPSLNLSSYMMASTPHTILNESNEPMTEAAMNFVSKFIPLSIASGVNQIYNIIPTVGNMLGGEYEMSDFKAAVSSYDSDLSKYYTEHQLGTDVMGFVAGSLVPGLGGIKILHGGQFALRTAIEAGSFGKTLGTGFGILAPTREIHIANAVKTIAATGDVFAVTEANTLRALGAGFGQQALEGAAFTALTNATMYNSPVLSGRDAKDLVWDVAIGAGLGGLIGGSIVGLTAGYKIAKAGREAGELVAPYTQRGAAPLGTSEANKIVFNTIKLNEIPELPVSGPANAAGEVSDILAARMASTAKATKDKLLLEIRESFGKLAGDDQALAEIAYARHLGLDAETTTNNLLDAQIMSRMGTYSKFEREVAGINAKIKKGMLDSLTPEELDVVRNHKVSYFKLHGENVGAISEEAPSILTLADKLKNGEKIELTKDMRGLQVGKKFYPNSNNPHRAYNIFAADYQTTQARYHWAELLPKWVDDRVTPIQVHETDLPLLTKAINDGLERISIIPESGVIADARTLGSAREIIEFTKTQKSNLAARLAKTQPQTYNTDILVDKLKSILGINFNVTDDPALGAYGWWTRMTGKIAGETVTGDIIALEKGGLSRPLSQLIRTLKHEEGHSIYQALLDAKGVTNQNLNTMYPLLATEIRAISKLARPGHWKSKDPGTQEYLNRAHEMFADTFGYLSTHPDQLKKYPAFNDFAGHLVRPIPQEVLDSAARRATKYTQEEIAKIVDVDSKVLTGEITEEGYFARKAAQKEYTKSLTDSGARLSEHTANVHDLPQYAKVTTRYSPEARNVDGNIMEAMTVMKTKEVQYRDSTKRVYADVISKLYDKEQAAIYAQLPDAPRNPYTTGNVGPTAFGAEAGSYGTPQSWAAYIGQRVHKMISHAKESTSNTFTPLLQKMAVDEVSAVEFSVLTEKMRNLPQRYAYNKELGSLVYKGTVQEILEASNKGFPIEVPITNDLTKQLVQAHITSNNTRISALKQIRSNEGFKDARDGNLFYPIPRNPKETPFFAFVVDDTVTGTGHSKMLYAASDKELQVLMQEASAVPGLKVLTKSESEAYFKAHGQFEFERSINENYINNKLARAGGSSGLFPVTDPKKIVTDFLGWHQARDASLVRELVSHRYSVELHNLRAQAEPALAAAKSKFGYVSPQAYAENTVNSPAADMMKMMLDLSKSPEYPLWTSFNGMLDAKVSQVWKSVSDLWEKAVHPDQLADINAALDRAGYGGPLVTEGVYAAMNGSIPRGTLTALVAKANGLIATFALRLDPLNALNNLVGSTVLLGTETQAVISAIKSGSKEGAGELAVLYNLKVPGVESAISSPQKLIANSISRYHQNPELRQVYKDQGFITTISEQYDQALDMLALRTSDTAESYGGRINELFKKAKTAGDVGEKITGNKFAEEFNRFVAADVMKQITDIAVKHNIIDEQAAWAYINTFVNRTQGNYLASQRPLVFQGPVGQAMGLFQTYQFNMIQQLTRHIGEGQGKNAAIMMGLQGSIYGMNGLPAFNAMNTHIIGTASGNKEHKDLYQSIYSGAGQEAAEWITYGFLSNAFGMFSPELKTNMYGRGDVNPRNLTIVPVNPAEFPIVKATTKMFNNIKSGFEQVAMGADVWGTFLHAVEQNGVSRPLAGMAFAVEAMGRDDKKVVSSTDQSNLLMAHDLVSLSTGVRILGGKPMDEAITQDMMFRINTYRAHDLAKRKSLAEGIKTSILSGAEPDQGQIDDFAYSYAKTGGKQNEFAPYMAKQYRNANVSQAEQLRGKLQNPYSQHLQSIMSNSSTITSN